MSVRDWRSWPRRLGFRLTAAMLLVSVPLMVVLAVLLTTSASSSLSESNGHKGISVARAVALRIEDWLAELAENLDQVAATAADDPSGPGTRAALLNLDETSAGTYQVGRQAVVLLDPAALPASHRLGGHHPHNGAAPVGAF